MHKLKCAACAVLDNQDRETKVRLIAEAIDRLNNDLALLRDKQSASTLYGLANRPLLVKCYDNKTVKSPGLPSIGGLPSCG